MESASARVSRSRPFYSAHARAYDLLISDPVQPWVDVVHEALVAHRLTPARILDAGCGTGRHAAALSAKGHRLTLADASPDLLAIAAERCPHSPAWNVDLTSLHTAERFEAVTCRGVLNDLLADGDRQAALDALAGCLRQGGLLLCDVREAAASAARAGGTARRTEVVVPAEQAAARGGSAGRPSRRNPAEDDRLVFTSTPRWAAGLVLVHEEHELRTPSGVARSSFDFAMRPWTRAELTDGLHRAGLVDVQISPGAGEHRSDHLTVTAERPPGT